MTTECTQVAFEFQHLKKRAIRAQFDGGMITSDGGGLLLREVEKRSGIVRQFAACFTWPSGVIRALIFTTPVRLSCLASAGYAGAGFSIALRSSCAQQTVAVSSASSIRREARAITLRESKQFGEIARTLRIATAYGLAGEGGNSAEVPARLYVRTVSTPLSVSGTSW